MCADAGRSEIERPQFNQLLFGRGRPTYVVFDVLVVDGVDLRPLPLKLRKAALARIGKGAEGWIALTNGIVDEGRTLYRTVVDADPRRHRRQTAD
jgi:ATP-dependent DNA ligase